MARAHPPSLRRPPPPPRTPPPTHPRFPDHLHTPPSLSTLATWAALAGARPRRRTSIWSRCWRHAAASQLCRPSQRPLVVRFEKFAAIPRFMCSRSPRPRSVIKTPAFPSRLRGGPLPRWCLVARRMACEAREWDFRSRGRRRCRAFPNWFELYPFAHIEPVRRKTDKPRARALAAVGASRT